MYNNWTPRLIGLAVACFLVGVGMGVLGYHYFPQPEAASSDWQFTRIGPTKEMVENIIFYDDGKQEVINPKGEDGTGIVSLLTRTLHELNLEATCVFIENDIQRIKQEDKVVELVFEKPINIIISQWVEPEERYHIPVGDNGYRILESVKTSLFILEDNLDEGLEAHILVGHQMEGKIGYGCWAVQQQGSNELDKNCIHGVNQSSQWVSELSIPLSSGG